MGVLYGVGNALVEPLELRERWAAGPLVDFAEAARRGASMELELTEGRTVRTEDLVQFRRASRGGRASGLSSDSLSDPLGFEPIGLGRPLAVELLAAWTGDAPGRSLIDRALGRSKPDLLVVSAAKAPQDPGTAPRAINQLVKDIDDRVLYRPSALREGAPLMYYSPAVVDATTYLSVELVVDSFSGAALSTLGGLMASAAGLPVFAPAATWLLAGSVVARAGDRVGHALAETEPFLHASEDLRFDSAGFPVDLARFLVFADDRHLPELRGYRVRVDAEGQGSARVGLVHARDGSEYRGDVPFVIASLDGREREEFEGFKPAHATAALLERFYGTDALGATADVLREAMTLWNDLEYRTQALELIDALEGMARGSDERKAAEKRLKALVKNIVTEAFRQGLE